jgi:excinuclease ABC subunit C
LGIEPPCLISLAKKDEEIFRPEDSEPIRLGRHSSALRLLQYVRDEAHRFAQHYHHVLRHKKLENEIESAFETEKEPKDNANPTD